ncbi:MAG: AMP-binding protein [Bacteroidales bacterium]|jgi:long-chain acyl-CoA synthetase|nr:AMP-binding protein [Bacteroidales bacterium]MDD3735704.1 AMP-binding protein [Bacteroidales bacterium]NLD63661.1 AMP-binding protein [Bacteroidales bacterium]HNT92273.1 AMP-binding protein [Bacteroidales bacterium]HOO65578.1 AMP-binding protein [Bacteroidales bacterium]
MKSLIRFFEENVEKYASNIYLWEKLQDKYEGTTYQEARRQVHEFGAGLMQLGIKKGDRVSLLADGRNSWVIGELGILYAGGVNVPLSIKLNAEEIRFRLAHSGSRMVITSSTQAQKILEVIDRCPELEKVIFMDPREEYSEKQIHFNEVRKIGREWLENPANRKSFEEFTSSITPSDFANICYTSGTTADPKGIILTHGNYVTNVYQSYSLMDIPQYYKTLLILPWDHSFAHTAGIYAFMGKGASIASVKVGKTPMETLRNIPICMKEIKPNLLMSVPALAKNFRKNIEKGIREKGRMTETLFNFALNMAYSYNKEGYNRGKGIQKLKKPLLRLFDKILFTKVREAFGGELDFFIGGGALLDIELQRFFYAIGVPMYQGYGLSEASPIISSNSAKRHKLGSSGFLVNNMELKICDDDGNEVPTGQKGEIVIRGGNVMHGYWMNESATAEAIRDGWLYTGDMGYMSEDGFLYVMGRFKSLLIADDGEKFSPEGIEEAISEQSKYIDQCMLYNNQKPYTVALLVPNQHALKLYLDDHNLSATTEEGKRAVLNLIENEVNEYRINGKYGHMFPHRWLPVALGVLNESFNEENGMMNSTMKIVRGKITERYSDLIEWLYTPMGKIVYNERNMEEVEKMKLG